MIGILNFTLGVRWKCTLYEIQGIKVTNPPTGMFLRVGRKSENPEETHMDKQIFTETPHGQ